MTLKGPSVRRGASEPGLWTEPGLPSGPPPRPEAWPTAPLRGWVMTRVGALIAVKERECSWPGQPVVGESLDKVRLRKHLRTNSSCNS